MQEDKIIKQAKKDIQPLKDLATNLVHHFPERGMDDLRDGNVDGASEYLCRAGSAISSYNMVGLDTTDDKTSRLTDDLRTLIKGFEKAIRRPIPRDILNSDFSLALPSHPSYGSFYQGGTSIADGPLIADMTP